MKRLLLASSFTIAALVFPVAAPAADADYKLVIENHKFQPTEITIPAGKKIRLQIENRDDTPEEFDSHDLNREKVFTGKGTATVFIGPLTPGRYTFQGEFHPDTAQGAVIAK